MFPEPDERDLRKRLLLNRHDPVALSGLAALLRARGEPLAAARLLQTLCKVAPVDGAMWLELARVWGEAGEYGAALDAVHRAQAAGAEPLQARLLQADLQERAGRLGDAVASWRWVLGQLPESLEVRINLASVMRLAGDLDGAIEMLETARSRDPTRVSLLNNLANALREAGRLEDAESLYAQSTLEVTVPGEVHFNHGLTLLQLGRGEAALKAFGAALTSGADLENTQLQIAETQISLGRFEAAQNTLEHLLAEKPQAARALYLLAQIASPGAAAALVGRMDTLASSTHLSVESKEALDYGRGRLHHLSQNYSLAQKHYRAANRSARQRLPQSVREALAVRLDALLKTAPEHWRELSARIAPTRTAEMEHTPVFIVGMPRSGTTLLESLLARHREFAPAGEVDALPALLRQCTSHLSRTASLLERQHALDSVTAEQLRKAYQRRLQALGANGGRAFSDKTPFNFELLGLVHALWPRARVLHCVRDVADTCLSIYFQQFGALPFSHDLADIARVQVGQEACMAYWAQALPGLGVQRVDYAALVTRPQETLAPVWASLQLVPPEDEAATPVGKEARLIHTASRWQVRQGVAGAPHTHAAHYPALVSELDKALNRYRRENKA